MAHLSIHIARDELGALSAIGVVAGCTDKGLQRGQEDRNMNITQHVEGAEIDSEESKSEAECPLSQLTGNQKDGGQGFAARLRT